MPVVKNVWIRPWKQWERLTLLRQWMIISCSLNTTIPRHEQSRTPPPPNNTITTTTKTTTKRTAVTRAKKYENSDSDDDDNDASLRVAISWVLWFPICDQLSHSSPKFPCGFRRQYESRANFFHAIGGCWCKIVFGLGINYNEDILQNKTQEKTMKEKCGKML